MQIAPRLQNGKSRVSFGSRLPEEIKNGLRKIANKEGRSMSWVMEEIIIDYCGFKPPVYKERVKK